MTHEFVAEGYAALQLERAGGFLNHNALSMAVKPAA